ncbi:MAG TPA: hypothetical protein VFW87_27370 [Pirellulales bacterium]|nr:hypothetical protein [Pirellulales bacterium]
MSNFTKGNELPSHRRGRSGIVGEDGLNDIFAFAVPVVCSIASLCAVGLDFAAASIAALLWF